jgi:hypothetical protein
MKKPAFLAFFFVCGFLYCEASFQGYWKIVDRREGFTQTIVAVYEYDDALYGRNIVNFDESSGDLIDTIYQPSLRVPNIAGTPFLTETSLFWGLEREGSRWKHGKILDPRSGRIYSCELRIRDETLILRGKWGPFFRNQPLYPATADDYPAGFALPDTRGWVPKIPVIE